MDIGASRNVCIERTVVLHLSSMRTGNYYIDKNVTSGAVHVTVIFNRIINLVYFFLAREGFQVLEYIVDIYAHCHEDKAEEDFQTLTEFITNMGLPINPSPQNQSHICHLWALLKIVIRELLTVKNWGRSYNCATVSCFNPFWGSCSFPVV